MLKKEKKHECRSTYRLCLYALMMCALILAGCAQQTSAPPSMKLLGSVLHIEQHQGIDTSDLMKVAEDVLAGMYFAIDKADANVGVIRTRPLPAAQFFEFWRSDNVGADNTLAANIHTIRRTVTLNISQQDKELQIGCEVQAHRLSMLERQVSSSARIYGIFSQSSPLLQRLILNPEQKKDMAWIDLGRDSRLEAEILKRIEAKIADTSDLSDKSRRQKGNKT